jgi:UDP-N-acetyl-D-mannosaminuronate dehydrogenase
MGLPTAALLAQSGLRVVGGDINQQTVENVNSGISPIMEPGLDEIVREKPSMIKNWLLICTRPFLNPKDFHIGGVHLRELVCLETTDF